MRKPLFILATIVALGLTACSTDTPTAQAPAPATPAPAPPAEPVIGNTLNHITCAEVNTKVEAYGTWIGEYLSVTNEPCNSANEVPRYWDINVDELERVLRYCTGNVQGDSVLRVYLGRAAGGSSQLVDLVLVPIGENGGVPVEDLDHAHDLILPCPSTCQQPASGLDYSFLSSVNTKCPLSSVGEAKNPCGR